MSNSKSFKDCHFTMPNPTIVNQFLDQCFKIIYPGYFERISIDYKKYLDNLKLKTRNLFLSEIKKMSLDSNLVDCFFKQLSNIQDSLEKDIKMAFLSDPAASDKEEIILTYPGIYAITTYRIAHELYQLKIPVIPRMLSEIAHSKTGIDIHPGAKIGQYFFIDHGTGVVIGETCQIGDYVKIYQGVTLGALSLQKGHDLKGTKRHPTIKDHVTIYANASILGGNTIIGNHVTIGSNVLIMESVEDHQIVFLKKMDLIFKQKNV